MGRPTTCTDEITEEIAELLRKGNLLETAYAYVGVLQQTAHNWRQKGRKALEEAGGDIDAIEDDNRRIWAKFFVATRRARAEAEVNAVKVVYPGGGKNTEIDARDTQWWLERSRQDTWGQRKQKLEHTGEGGGSISIEIVRGDEADGDGDSS